MLGSLASSVRGGARFGAQVCALAPSVARRAASGQQTTELQEGSVHVNGVELYYTESPGSGSGLPTLVALPGALGTAATDFGPQLRDLGNHLKVVSFDPRGYGRSRPPNRDFPVDFYQRDADDAAGLMEALGYDQYTVMGWSDGAMSAVLLAAAYSSRVERLIIFGGNAFLTNEDIDAFEATRDVAKTWSTRMRETHEPVYGKVGLQTLWSSAVDAWGNIYEQNDGKVCVDEARTIECPTLVMHGEKDPICLAEHPQWFCDNIPGASGIPMKVFPEGKHNFHLRYAEEANEAIIDFCTDT